MFDFYVTCKRCGKEDLHGWHPVWDWGKTRQLCVECREEMYKRHRVWMDKILKQWREHHETPITHSKSTQ
jgi:hypothetical protein